MSTPDATFEYLPLPGLRWAAPTPGGPLSLPVSNRAFGHAYTLATLPEFQTWADGSHTLRLHGRCGIQSLCRVYLSTLPDRTRLGIIEDVQDDYQDPLTGLDIRRALRLDAARPLQNVGLALLDIDGFKGVNDAHGHAAGDALLVALAELLRASARSWGARAYRLGGDEFVILGAGPLDAGKLEEIQDQFRRSAARRGLKVQGFSCGLSRAPQDSQTLCELLEQADAHLMRQKLDRRGTMAAQLLRHFQSEAAVEATSPDRASSPEGRSFQMHRAVVPVPRSLRAEKT